MNQQELAARLLATFLDELDEQLRVLNADLLALEGAPGDAERLRSVFRVAHTLKGAARAVGVPLVERLCHTLESMLSDARAEARPLEPAQIALLYQAADVLADAGARLRGRQSLDDSPLAALSASLAGSPSPGAARPVPGVTPDRTRRPEAGGAGGEGAVATPGGERAESALRVQAVKLNALQASVEDLVLTSARTAGRAADVEALDGRLGPWAAQWRRSARRLRRDAGRADGDDRRVDAAAVARVLDDAERQIDRLAREVRRLAAAAASDARALARATDDVADHVRMLRMRPFVDVCEALPRAVRDVAVESGRDARLALDCADVEADRAVLDGLREALLHLVRNAVDHGIETPDVRRRRGKPPRGTVRVSAALRGDRLVVTVADDGAGLDAAAIRASLERAGRRVPGDDRRIARALLDGGGGVSTRAEASVISGRGVGLDVVRAAVDRLGGSVDLSWVAGEGTTVTLDCPVTLARLRAVLVTVGGRRLAIPTAQVDRLLRVRRADVRRADGREVVVASPADADRSPVPLVALARLLEPAAAAPAADPLLAAVLRAGPDRLAVAVDELLAEQELIVRPLPGGGAVSPLLAGAAMLPAGGIALVLDVPALVAAGLGAGADAGPDADVRAPAAASRPRPRILVVDDSVTTRTLEQGVFEAAGYDVATAADGAEGWRLVQERGFDVVVADVEMPRMDGFELCRAIRASRPHAALPVVLVTALESAEHRARGLAAGADAYIGKSGFDERTLLDVVGQLVGQLAGDEAE